MPLTVTFSMCPYRDTWVISQKASAALKYMSGVGAEPSPPRFGPSSHANVLCAVPLWLTVASFKNGVTDVTSASNTISRRWMVGSRPSGSVAMAPPRKLVAVMKTRRERSWREGPHPRDHRSVLVHVLHSADAEGVSRLFVEDGVFEIGFEIGAADSPAGTIRPA